MKVTKLLDLMDEGVLSTSAFIKWYDKSSGGYPKGVLTKIHKILDKSLDWNEPGKSLDLSDLYDRLSLPDKKAIGTFIKKYR